MKATSQAFAGFTGPVLGLTLGLACSPSEPTELVPGVSTQMRIPEGLESVALVVSALGRQVHCDTYRVVDGQVTLPATLGILGERLPAGTLVTVQVLGFRVEQPPLDTDCGVTVPIPDASEEGEPVNEVVVVRRRRLGFSPDRILFLPMPLKESCKDVRCEEEGTTCIGGKCVEMDIDASILPEYRDELIFGTTNTCFDPDFCMANAATVPVRMIDANDCTFEAILPEDIPQAGAGYLNVRMHYNTFGTEILDLDLGQLDPSQHEGISLPEGEPQRFRLAKNLCESQIQESDKILRIEASPVCPTKSMFQPICEGSADGSGEGLPSLGGASVAPAGICTWASLTSVESAVYVLMDRSASMARYFGPNGLQFAVGLPLESPVARETSLAFEFMPASTLECEADPLENRFEEPSVFGFSRLRDATDAAETIGERLLDPATVSPDSPPLYMAAAMQGAYQALGDLTPVKPGTQEFNRRALVVIANRDFGGICAPDGLTPEQTAEDAFANQGIYTYAVVLEDGDDPAAVVDATSIATAGGTTVFNGVADEVEGAKAVQDILNDLGSCLYEVRSFFDAEFPDDALISYLNPLEPNGAPRVIQRNDACDEGTQDIATGWSQEEGSEAAEGLIRVCGADCESLRTLLDDVALANAALGSVAPPIPLVVTGSCPEDEVIVPLE